MDTHLDNPSADDIDKVKNNLNKMISFNQDVLSNANYKLENAYTLLTQTDDKDFGLELGLNLLSSCFSELASDLLGQEGSIAASFLTGLVSNYATTKPNALNDLFSSLLIRVQKTILQTNEDLSNYYQDPVSNWSKVVGGTYKTPFGTFNTSGKVSDLVNIDFPNKDHPQYYQILNSCLKGMDQGIWATLLTRFVITDYQEDKPPMWELPCNPNDEDNDFLAVRKAFYHVWTYHEDKDCYGNLVKYYIREEYNIGTGASAFSTNDLSDAACDYLFQNYASTISNPDGLFKRDFVFTKLNIPTAIEDIHNVHESSISDLFKCCCCRYRKNKND